MRQMRQVDRQQLLAAAVLLAGGIGIVTLYTLARGLTWQFDDWINLRGLAEASSRAGLETFLYGGIAGPSGRPLALLSFLPNYADWPGHPWGFVRHSLTWHLLNAGLVFLLLRRLFAQQPGVNGNAFWMAGLGSVLWALLPIHASGILMPVQRMTLVSAFFVLAGLLIYASLRVRLAGRPALQAWPLLGGVLLSTAMAAYYAKENGALLLMFVPLLEWTFFSRLPTPGRHDRMWRIGMWLMLTSVPLAVAWTMVAGWAGMQQVYQYVRDFTLAERLATELVVLWEYLRQILLPRPMRLGPYHDGHAVYGWLSPWPWLALLAWAAALLVAFRLRNRRGPERLLWFGLLFYLTAHSMEASVIPLELYFEHRNYLATLGIVVPIVALFAYALRQPNMRTAVSVGLLLWASYLGFSLQQATSLWGQPLLAGEMWKISQPHSTRAAQYLAWQYREHDFDQAALRLLDEHALDGDAGVAIQATTLACMLESPDALHRRLQALRAAIPGVRRPASVVTGLSALGNAVRSEHCDGIPPEDYRDFLEALLAGNPMVQGNHRVRHNIHHELAATHADMGEDHQRVHYLKLAYRDFPTFSGAQTVALALFEQGEAAAALRWIDTAPDLAPNAASREAWNAELSSLRSAIEEVSDMFEDDGG